MKRVHHLEVARTARAACAFVAIACPSALVACVAGPDTEEVARVERSSSASNAAPITERSWREGSTGTTSSLRGLCALDARVAWATGSGGTVVRTLDGGANWLRCEAPIDGAEIRDVEAFDAERAIVLAVTEPAAILATEDGGDTWRELYRHPAPTAFLDSIAFADERTGCVFGDPVDGAFVVALTRDGGATWTTPTALPAPAAGEAAFAASGTCVVAVGSEHLWIGTGGKRARVLRSADGGATWSAADTPMIEGEPTTGTYSVAFADARRGILVGGDYTKPEEARANAAYTLDGGATWQLATTLPRGQRAGVAWSPDGAWAIAVGRTGCELSRDGGRTWTPLGDLGFYAVDVTQDGAVWAVGARGRFGRLE